VLAAGVFRLVTQRLRTRRTEPRDGPKKADQPVSPRRGPAADAAP